MNESGGNWERGVIEKLALEALKEQKRARRWGIFFKSLLAIYVLGFLLVIAWGSLGETQLAGRHTVQSAVSSQGLVVRSRGGTGHQLDACQGMGT